MEEETKTPLTDYYSKPYQGKRYKENGSESFIVPGVIKIIAWIALIVGMAYLAFLATLSMVHGNMDWHNSNPCFPVRLFCHCKSCL